MNKNKIILQFRIIVLAALLILWISTLHAQNLFRLPRISHPITLDGKNDETAWQNIEPLPLVNVYPNLGAPFSEKTEIKVAYDNHYIYASGHFYGSNPSDIRGNSLVRDRGSNSDDYFALILDTFNDNENALAFMTTPAGIRVDQSIFNDGEFLGAMPFNESWNTFWDVVSIRTEKGWFSEMRIPFTSLRFQDKNGNVIMGLKTWRWISHIGEVHSFPSFPPKWDMGHIKPSQSQDVLFEGIFSRKPIYITPYFLGGFDREAELNNIETDYLSNDQRTGEAGLDVKYGLTNNLTLDLTVNTDFAQVESDDEQVNLTRFSLFFPEKRLFFQERSSIFDFNTEGFSKLFYSRRIGLNDDGDPVRILGGARMVGRIGGWDIGFLDLHTANSDSLPSENFGVLRLRRQTFNENSYVGGMVTSRVGNDGSYNYAYGLDGIFKLGGDEYLNVSWVQSIDDEIVKEDRFSFQESSRFRAQLQRRGNTGVLYDFGIAWSGDEYDPGMGFVFRNNFTRLGNKIGYGWLMDEKSKFQNISISLAGFTFHSNSDGSLESAQFGPEFSFGLKSVAFGLVGLKMYHEYIDESFELSDDVDILPGKYTYYALQGFYQSPFSQLLQTALNFQIGSFFDGNLISIGLTPTWTISRYLELGGSYQFNRARFSDRDITFKADVMQLRVRISMNTKLSTSTFVQYNNQERQAILNFRFRYNFREGNDLYVVYNEGINTNRFREIPTLPVSDQRTVLVKYSHTFQAVF